MTVQAERVAEKRAKFETYLLTDKLGALNGVKDIDCCYAEATAVEEGVEVVVEVETDDLGSLSGHCHALCFLCNPLERQREQICK